MHSHSYSIKFHLTSNISILSKVPNLLLQLVPPKCHIPISHRLTSSFSTSTNAISSLYSSKLMPTRDSTVAHLVGLIPHGSKHLGSISISSTVVEFAYYPCDRMGLLQVRKFLPTLHNKLKQRLNQQQLN